MLNLVMGAKRSLVMIALLWPLLVIPVVYGVQDGLSGGYRITEMNELADGSGVVASLKLISGSSTYGPDLEDLKLTARYEEGGRVHIHITDASQPRWEVPTSLIPRDRVQDAEIGKPASENTLVSSHPLKITWTSEPFSFAITRRSNGEVLFNTLPEVEDEARAFNPLVFKDQYLEISTRLPNNSFLYGLGESTRPDGMRLVQGKTYTLWATDVGSWNVDVPLYSTYPLYLDMRKGGQAHGVLFMNSNGMDVDYKTGDLLTFKAIGGVFDFYFFAGPSPMAILDQYTALVGRPAAMPYWALGFHQSRYGYNTLEELETVMAKYDAINFPVESIWSDIDHMDAYKDFTLSPERFPEEKLRGFVKSLHEKDQKFVMIIDPGIAIDENYATYTRGREHGVYLKNGTGNGADYIAQVWPGFTTIPDFLHPNAVDWWTKELEEFYKMVPYDGLWLDMNEPANFCSGSNCWYDPAVPCDIIDVCCMTCDNNDDVLTRWDNPPYKINGLGNKVPIYYKTVAMTALHHDGSRIYDTHNIFGMAEGQVTFNALQRIQKKRPFVLSRSCFVGSSKHTARWTGDNGATWNDLRYSVSSLLNSGLFGAPMVGADICGFYFETNEELCERWSQVGAFYPFARSHSDLHSGPQELYLWKSVAKTASDVFYWRYRLLPFFYTLMYEATHTGAPINRPLFFEFPEDEETWSNDRQFLLGNAILVSPVLEAAKTSVRAYFPKGIWFNLFDYSKMIRAADHGIWEELPAPKDVINVHIRQGSIVPMQDFAMTTAAARKSPFSLLVAFAPASDFAEFCAVPYSIVCQGTNREYATGQIFIDDDNQPTMEITSGRASYIKLEAIRTDGHYALRSYVTRPEYVTDQKLMLNSISVLGVQSQPFSVRVNGHLAAVQVKVDVNASVMELSNLNLPMGEEFELVWNTIPNGSSAHAR